MAYNVTQAQLQTLVEQGVLVPANEVERLAMTPVANQVAIQIDTQDVWQWEGSSWLNIGSIGGGGGGGGATNLSYDALTRVLSSSTGTGTTLPLAVASTSAGLLSATDKAKLDGIASGAQVNVGTDLSYTAATRLLASSTGADVALPEAVASTTAGLMSAADKAKLDGIESGAQANVATDLSYTAASRLLASSTGADVTLPEVVAGGNSGLMSGSDKTKLNGIAAGAQVNVATDLSYTAATRLLASSTGADVTLPEVVAGGTSGLMSGSDKTKLNGITTGATLDLAAPVYSNAGTFTWDASQGSQAYWLVPASYSSLSHPTNMTYGRVYTLTMISSSSFSNYQVQFSSSNFTQMGWEARDENVPSYITLPTNYSAVIVQMVKPNAGSKIIYSVLPYDESYAQAVPYTGFTVTMDCADNFAHYYYPVSVGTTAFTWYINGGGAANGWRGDHRLYSVVLDARNLLSECTVTLTGSALVRSNGANENSITLPAGGIYHLLLRSRSSEILVVESNVALSTLAQGGATTGNVLVWSGSQWAPDTLVPSDLGQEGATNGQAILWSDAESKWLPGTVSGGGGAIVRQVGTTATVTVASTTTHLALDPATANAQQSVVLDALPTGSKLTITAISDAYDATVALSGGGGGGTLLNGALLQDDLVETTAVDDTVWSQIPFQDSDPLSNACTAEALSSSIVSNVTGLALVSYMGTGHVGEMSTSVVGVLKNGTLVEGVTSHLAMSNRRVAALGVTPVTAGDEFTLAGRAQIDTDVIGLGASSFVVTQAGAGETYASLSLVFDGMPMTVTGGGTGVWPTFHQGNGSGMTYSPEFGQITVETAGDYLIGYAASGRPVDTAGDYIWISVSPLIDGFPATHANLNVHGGSFDTSGISATTVATLAPAQVLKMRTQVASGYLEMFSANMFAVHLGDLDWFSVAGAWSNTMPLNETWQPFASNIFDNTTQMSRGTTFTWAGTSGAEALTVTGEIQGFLHFAGSARFSESGGTLRVRVTKDGTEVAGSLTTVGLILYDSMAPFSVLCPLHGAGVYRLEFSTPEVYTPTVEIGVSTITAVSYGIEAGGGGGGATFEDGSTSLQINWSNQSSITLEKVSDTLWAIVADTHRPVGGTSDVVRQIVDTVSAGVNKTTTHLACDPATAGSAQTILLNGAHSVGHRLTITSLSNTYPLTINLGTSGGGGGGGEATRWGASLELTEGMGTFNVSSSPSILTVFDTTTQINTNILADVDTDTLQVDKAGPLLFWADLNAYCATSDIFEMSGMAARTLLRLTSPGQMRSAADASITGLFPESLGISPTLRTQAWPGPLEMIVSNASFGAVNAGDGTAYGVLNMTGALPSTPGWLPLNDPGGSIYTTGFTRGACSYDSTQTGSLRIGSTGTYLVGFTVDLVSGSSSTLSVLVYQDTPDPWMSPYTITVPASDPTNSLCLGHSIFVMELTEGDQLGIYALDTAGQMIDRLTLWVTRLSDTGATSWGTLAGTTPPAVSLSPGAPLNDTSGYDLPALTNGAVTGDTTTGVLTLPANTTFLVYGRISGRTPFSGGAALLTSRLAADGTTIPGTVRTSGIQSGFNPILLPAHAVYTTGGAAVELTLELWGNGSIEIGNCQLIAVALPTAQYTTPLTVVEGDPICAGLVAIGLDTQSITTNFAKLAVFDGETSLAGATADMAADSITATQAGGVLALFEGSTFLNGASAMPGTWSVELAKNGVALESRTDLYAGEGGEYLPMTTAALTTVAASDVITAQIKRSAPDTIGDVYSHGFGLSLVSSSVYGALISPYAEAGVSVNLAVGTTDPLTVGGPRAGARLTALNTQGEYRFVTPNTVGSYLEIPVTGTYLLGFQSTWGLPGGDLYISITDGISNLATAYASTVDETFGVVAATRTVRILTEGTRIFVAAGSDLERSVLLYGATLFAVKVTDDHMVQYVQDWGSNFPQGQGQAFTGSPAPLEYPQTFLSQAFDGTGMVQPGYAGNYLLYLCGSSTNGSSPNVFDILVNGNPVVSIRREYDSNLISATLCGSAVVALAEGDTVAVTGYTLGAPEPASFTGSFGVVRVEGTYLSHTGGGGGGPGTQETFEDGLTISRALNWQRESALTLEKVAANTWAVTGQVLTGRKPTSLVTSADSPFQASVDEVYWVDVTDGAVTILAPASPQLGDSLSVRYMAGDVMMKNLTVCDILVDTEFTGFSVEYNGTTWIRV